MSRTPKRTKATPATYLVIILVIAVACLGVTTYMNIKKVKTQDTSISDLKKQVKELTPPGEQELLSYQKLHPKMKNKMPDKWNSDKKTVYLTFDDGPSKVTPDILKALKKENVKATFFVIGEGSDHKLMKKIVDEGHAIGIHAYEHNYKKLYESVDSYVKDFYKIYKLIQDETGVTPTAYRYPGGSNNVFNTLLQPQTTAEMFRRGFVPFDWNVSSGDAGGGGDTASQIAKLSLSGTDMDRPIVLMHDAAAKSETAKALPAIIKGYKAKGYEFGVLTNEDAPILFSTPDGSRYE